jgi:adenosine 3'-phospho 5'-phosphosulfate transporter B3
MIVTVKIIRKTILLFSLQYLNYPTQVIFKSCKLIPVLIGGILIQRKQKGLLDFVAAIVMSFGLAVFVLADSQVDHYIKYV